MLAQAYPMIMRHLPVLIFKIKSLYCGRHRTTTVCPNYRGVRAVEHYKGVFYWLSLAVRLQKRLSTVHTSAIFVELISRGEQPFVRGKRASALSNELCTVQVAKGPKNLSTLRNSGVSAFQGL